MNDSEREPKVRYHLAATLKRLTEDQLLVLGRGGGDIIDEHGVTVERVAIDSSDVNELSAERYRTARTKSRDVTDEFRDVAQQIMTDPDFRLSPSYPCLTVINDCTGARSSEIIEVAGLVAGGNAQLLSSEDGHFGIEGEEIGLDIEALVTDMAQRVGVESPGGMVTIDDGVVAPVCALHLDRRTWVSNVVSDTDPWALDSRGEGTLALIQMDIVRTFLSSGLLVNQVPTERPEVAIRVAPQPNYQRVLANLIDIAESHHARIVCGIEFDAEEHADAYTISVMDDMGLIVADLATEQWLDIAIQNAAVFAPVYFARTHDDES